MSGAPATFSDGLGTARVEFAGLTPAPASLRAIRVAGPVGPRGPAGLEAVELLADGAISGGRAVMGRADGLASYPDGAQAADGAAIIGITRHAAADGAAILVQLGGPLEDVAFNFQPGPVFAGHLGVLTQIRPQISWFRRVGVAVTPTKLVIQPGPAIQLLE